MSSNIINGENLKYNAGFINVFEHHNLLSQTNDISDQIGQYIDSVIQRVPKSLNSSFAFEKAYGTEAGATWGSKFNYSLKNVNYLDDVYIMMDLPVATNAVQEVVNYVQSCVDAACTGEFWFCLTNDQGPSLNTDNIKTETSAKLLQNASAANIQTLLNDMTMVKEAGGLTVVLNSGTIAGINANLDIKWNISAPYMPRIELCHSLTGSTAGKSVAFAKTLTVGEGYLPYVGLLIIASLIIKQSKTNIHDYGYNAVISLVLSELDEKLIQKFKKAAGGKYFASGRLYIPIPTFFASYVIGKGKKFSYPLGLMYAEDILDLEITLNSSASLCNGTASAGVITTTRIYYNSTVVEPQLEVFHKLAMKEEKQHALHGVDWITGNQLSIADSTVSPYNVATNGLKGTLKSLVIENKLVSTYDGGNKLYNLPFDTYEVKISNKIYRSAESQREIEFEQGLDEQELHMEFGEPLVIPFAKDVKNHLDFTGGFNNGRILNFEVNLSHKQGANCYARITASVNARYIIDGKGKISKQL